VIERFIHESKNVFEQHSCEIGEHFHCGTVTWRGFNASLDDLYKWPFGFHFVILFNITSKGNFIETNIFYVIMMIVILKHLIPQEKFSLLATAFVVSSGIMRMNGMRSL
jgi:hypothetical protein